MKKKYKVMNNKIVKLLFGGLLTSVFFISCEYREYADADYPANAIYQSLAVDGILYVDHAEPEDVGLPTPGAPQHYYLDAESGKLVINMGVIQSGVRLKSCTVDIDVNYSAVNKLIEDGTFDSETQYLPQAAYTLPERVVLADGAASAAFTLEIDTALFRSAQYYGKKFAIAVRIHSEEISVNPTLSTVVIYLDPAFLMEE